MGGSEGMRTGQFYDARRASGLASAALGHGEDYIGQECLQTVVVPL